MIKRLSQNYSDNPNIFSFTAKSLLEGNKTPNNRPFNQYIKENNYNPNIFHLMDSVNLRYNNYLDHQFEIYTEGKQINPNTFKLSSNGNNEINEVYTSNNIIYLDKINKISKSICKISYIEDGKLCSGTGFFIKLNNPFKCLLTNYHVISEKLLKGTIKIELDYQYPKKIIFYLKLNNRYMKFYSNYLDVTIIQIKNSDDLIKRVDFLSYDLNYISGNYDYIN